MKICGLERPAPTVYPNPEEVNEWFKIARVRGKSGTRGQHED